MYIIVFFIFSHSGWYLTLDSHGQLREMPLLPSSKYLFLFFFHPLYPPQFLLHFTSLSFFSFKHLYNWQFPSVGRFVGWSVGLLVTHSFDDPHVAPYWPIWPCSFFRFLFISCFFLSFFGELTFWYFRNEFGSDMKSGTSFRLVFDAILYKYWLIDDRTSVSVSLMSPHLFL